MHKKKIPKLNYNQKKSSFPNSNDNQAPDHPLISNLLFLSPFIRIFIRQFIEDFPMRHFAFIADL